MLLLNKGPSNSDFADGPLLCVECLLRACVRITYMRARARFLVLLNCHINYLFLSFFRVGRAFFKVEYNINCVTLSQMKTTTKNLIQMATSNFYSIFECSKGRKDLVFVSQSLEYARYVAGTFHDQVPSCNFKVFRVLGGEYNSSLTLCSVNGDLRKF